MSGSIQVSWPSLKIMRDEREWGAHRLKGVKGTDGKGVLKFKTVSGSVQMVGEEALLREKNDDRLGGCEDGQETVTEETGTEFGDDEVVLTPQSEAGDEWMMVQ